MKISIMTLENYEEVYALWSETAGMGLRSLDDSKAGIEQFLKRNPTTNFICIKAGRLVGAILCGHDGRRGYIYHAAVRKTCRRQGIGQQLVQAVLVALKAESIRKVALVVFSENEKGNAFWQTQGFYNREDLVYRNLTLVDQL